MSSHINATIKPRIVVADNDNFGHIKSALTNLHEQPLGVFHHSTLEWVLESIHKHLVEDVNVAYICCANVQDFIRGQEDRGDVQCCFIKHHIRKNAEGSLKSPRWYNFSKCNKYILVLDPTTLVILLMSYFQWFLGHLPSNFKPPTHCYLFPYILILPTCCKYHCQFGLENRNTKALSITPPLLHPKQKLNQICKYLLNNKGHAWPCTYVIKRGETHKGVVFANYLSNACTCFLMWFGFHFPREPCE